MIGTISLRYHPLMRRDADCINRHPRLRAEAEQGLRVSAPPRPLYSRLVLALVRESCGLESRDPDSLDPVRSGADEQTEGMRSRIHPAYKTKYSVANWASYDRALVRRGDVTLWLSPEAIATWEPARNGTRGGQPKYSHLAIETALTLRRLFHLPLRQTEGFLTSIFGIMGLDLSVPDHTTPSPRESVPGSLASSSAHGQPVTSRRGQYGPVDRW
jgi:hypothetical protein